jgi:hypothetical protein
MATALSDSESSDFSRRCFGYGRWDARCWFVGPEQGKGRSEGADISPRFRAFMELESEGLCDSKEFHARIGQLYYFEKIGKAKHPRFQNTWRRNILTLLAYRNVLEPGEAGSLQARMFQANSWGRRDDSQDKQFQTCVIDLCGLPAQNLKISSDRITFRAERLQEIHRKIEEHQPEFVVVFGKSQHQYWRELWASRPGMVSTSEGHYRLGNTKIAFATQPTALGQTDREWIELGQMLRN